MDVILIKNIKKKFGDTVILDDISLRCEEGKIYGIVGYNGSGKTVFFKCICGLLDIDEGEIKIHGNDYKKQFGSIGAVIEEPAFLKNKSAYNNLKYLYIIRNQLNKKVIRNTLSRVGLDSSDKKHISKYSMGMKQRLAIAQAIMEDPQILILDEPMNGLDKRGMQDMRELLITLRNQGKTILLASHNTEDIKILCDYVYIIENGKIKIQDIKET